MTDSCPTCKRPFIKQRSGQQNRAFFGIAVDKFAEHYGQEKEVMYKALAGAYFGFDEVSMGGLTIMVPKSTKKCTTKEFKEFYDWLQRQGAQVGIDIPSPNENIPAEHK